MIQFLIDGKGAVEGTDRTEITLNTTNTTKNAKPFINKSVKQPIKQQNENIIQQVDPTTMPIPNNTNIDVSQYRVYEDEDDAYNDLVNNSGNIPVQQPSKPKQPQIEVDQLYEDEKMAYGWEEADRRRNIRLKKPTQPLVQSIVETQEVITKKIQEPQMDPVEMMFKTFKRNHEIKINIEFIDKIGKPDFIKLMIENMDGDIVDFYKKLIVENIKNNFKFIEDEVEKQLRKEIFEENKVTIGYQEVGLDLTKETPDTDFKNAIETLTKISKQLVDKSNDIEFKDEYSSKPLYGIDVQDEIRKLTEQLVDKKTEITEELNKIDYLDEEVIRLININEPNTNNLIQGGKTSNGKQKYKYIDSVGKIRFVIPETAEKNGWKPITEN